MNSITSIPTTHSSTSAVTSDAGQMAVLQKHLASLEKEMAESRKSPGGSHTDDARAEMLAQQVAAVQAQIAEIAEQAAQKAAQKEALKKQDVQQVQDKQDTRSTQDMRDQSAKARAVAEGSKVGTNIDTFV